MEHYRVMRDKRNWVTVDDEEYFENLFKLVEVSHSFNNNEPVDKEVITSFACR